MADQDDVIHLENCAMDWQLRETTSATLTDGKVSEDLQRDRVRQMAQWLSHFPERLSQMEALTEDGRRALERARTRERNDRSWRW
jgi:hypothetical protein